MRPSFTLVGCALLAFVVLFWRLGEPTFWDPDEAHYAETTRELIVTGDWLTPKYNEQPFFDKPIFFHWLQSVPMRWFGPTEAAARLVPALAALALVVVTWWLGDRLAGPDVGRLAALILTANPAMFGLARYAILDSLMTALLFGGAAMVVVSALTDRPRMQYAGYVLVGLAVCVKGPLAVALCGIAFVLAIIASKEARRRLLALKWIQGLAIAIGIAIPWFALMLNRHDGAFIDGYFLRENFTLFARPHYGNQPRWWFYLEIAAVGFLPWTWMLIGRFYDTLRSSASRQRPPDSFETLLWCWTIAIIGFFSFSQFKLDHYVFPAAPALSLVCARSWVDAARTRDPTSTRGVQIGIRLIGPTLIAGGLALAVAAVRLLSLPKFFLLVPAVVVVLGGLATVRVSRVYGLPGVPGLALTALAALYVGVVVWVIPQIEAQKVVPDLARWIVRAPPAERVATFRLNRWNPAFRFYVDRHVDMLESDDDARRFFADTTPYYCVMDRQLYELLKDGGVPLQVVYSREGLWVTSGRMLWRQRSNLTTFVVTAHVAQAVR